MTMAIIFSQHGTLNKRSTSHGVICIIFGLIAGYIMIC